LNVNDLAKDFDYCVVEDVEPSPLQERLAYSVDFTGGERYALLVQNVATGELVENGSLVNDTDGTLVWGNDDDTYYYLKLDESLRPYQVYRHQISSNQNENLSEDELIFEEPDEMFWLGIHKTMDGRYLMIGSESTETSEVHFLDLQQQQQTRDSHEPVAPHVQCLAQRRKKVLYEIDHRHGTWWIHSNVGNLPNYALFSAPAVAHCQDLWQPVLLHGEPLFDGGPGHRSLDDVTCLDSHVLLSGREDGLPRIWLVTLDEEEKDTLDQDNSQCSDGKVQLSQVERLEFEEEAFDVGLAANSDFYAKSVLIAYDSLVTPTQYIDIELNNSTNRQLIKERTVPGYDKTLYSSKRTTVLSRDGKTEIPVDLLYRKSVMEEYESSGQPVPVHMYGYGAYGSCEEATFSSSLLPLLDRGIVYALAHVRGGGEMGRTWYEEPNGGKYLCKKNTFNDFVDVAKWLVDDAKLTTPDQLSCEGRSAGGLTVGASINQEPTLFRVAILGVPAVDMVATMADSSVNLVIVEWEEWGNPNEAKFFDYMKHYSPMENVKPNAIYPSCLLSGGLNDPRVQYWEPAKMTAQLRHGAAAKEDRCICLKMEMNAGHFSESDRYKYWRELAFDYAFLLDQLGLAPTESKRT